MSLKDKVFSKLGMEEGEDFGPEDIAALSLKCKNAAINRKDFLQEVLQGKYSQEAIDKAISETPFAAGIRPEDMQTIAEQLLKQAEETVTSDAKSTDLKETLTDDEKNILQKAKEAGKILQENRYKAEWNKLVQELLYLYGFPEIQINEDGLISSDESKLLVLLSTAAMYGIKNADTVLRAMAQAIPKMKGKKISMKQLECEDILKVLSKSCARSLGKGMISMVTGNIPLVGNVIREKNYADELEENYANLIEVLSDTALTSLQHEAGPEELAYAEKLLALVQD